MFAFFFLQDSFRFKIPFLSHWFILAGQWKDYYLT